MDIIHLLPDAVANQIAAGEVIQRPASVLKELVENAIDAKATYIQIIIKDAGRTLIRIIDNGTGMSETDARLAFERHATSKIKEAADLFSLHTMGFRGEALASIAAVAHVDLQTRRAEDELGTKVEIAGSRVTKQEPIMCPVGSVFSIKNLFFNVPARRRFLKKNSTEMAHLLTEFYRIALVNPHIAFKFTADDEELFDLPESNTKQRIDAIFGKISKKSFSQQLLDIETATNLVKIKGYIGRPEAAQKNAHQYFFVNGRYMRHPYFHKAVMTAYSGLLQGENTPNYFIYFELEPDMIDVNIHPTKTEIKFAEEQLIWPILMAAVKETLGKFTVAPTIDFDQDNALEMPVTNKSELGNIRPPQTSFNPNYNPFGNTSANYKRQPLDWEKLYAGFEKKETTKQATLPQTDMEKPAEPKSAEPNILHIDDTVSKVFQFKDKYILTPVKSGLMLIDQQRAHIRILYEQYLQQLEQRKGISQQLLFPETIEIGMEDTPILEDLLPDLRALGFDMEKNGKNTFSINGIPSDLNAAEITGTIHDILDASKNTAIDIRQNKQETVALSLAKATSIHHGKELGTEEMNDLINRLFACSAHAITPDGKPIVTIITHDELDKRFQ